MVVPMTLRVLLASREEVRPMDTIATVFQHVEALLLQCWQTTGFGTLVIESERLHGNGQKIRVLLQGSTCYRYVIEVPGAQVCAGLGLPKDPVGRPAKP